MLIFLDIDGVMVPAKSWESPPLLSDGFPNFSSQAVRVLSQLITAETKLVLTTSHKGRFTLGEWKAIFQRRGLAFQHIATLDVGRPCKNRLEELTQWFNTNDPVESYVILDDDKSLHALPFEHKNHLVMTDSIIGLNESHLESIDAVLALQSQFG